MACPPADQTNHAKFPVYLQDERHRATSRRYNRWLRAAGCDPTARKTTAKGRERVVMGLKRKHAQMSY